MTAMDIEGNLPNDFWYVVELNKWTHDMIFSDQCIRKFVCEILTGCVKSILLVTSHYNYEFADLLLHTAWDIMKRYINAIGPLSGRRLLRYLTVSLILSLKYYVDDSDINTDCVFEYITFDERKSFLEMEREMLRVIDWRIAAPSIIAPSNNTSFFSVKDREIGPLADLVDEVKRQRINKRVYAFME